MTPPKQLAIALLALSAALGAAAQPRPLPPGASDFTRWTFREDFSHGIPGWVSFPLSQDVGYDPSIYTEQVGGSPVLVRDIISYGQRLLRVGLARPIVFHAASSSSFRIVYDLEMCGRITSVHLALGAVDGRRFDHLLSLQPGVHAVQVEGGQMQIPAAGVDVEVLVLEAEVAAPALGAHSRLTLRALEIQAERPASVLVRAPKRKKWWRRAGRCGSSWGPGQPRESRWRMT
jgi:hypothetical protein